MRSVRICAGLAVLAAWMLPLPAAAAGPGGSGTQLFQRLGTRRSPDDHAGRGGRGGVALPKGARVERDIPYGPDPAQRMDAYVPANAAGAPVIFLVHGGAWMFGDKASAGVVANKVARWLPQGFIVVSVNYRLWPKAGPLEQADDVAKALAAAQAGAAAWGGDASRFVLMGHSAGAHLVGLLAADPGIASRQGARPWLGAVLLDSACLDVAETMGVRHMRFYDRVFGSDPAFWRRASPMDRLTSAPAPLLMVCSSFRRDSCPQARAFAAKAEELGGRAAVLPEALSHGEINRTLGLPGEYTAAVESFLRSLGLP
ncbi:MAG: alpha/beta hydrolase [Acidobacteriota bacterium]